MIINKFTKKLFGKAPFLKPIIEGFVQFECMIARKWVSNSHKRLKAIQWKVSPKPEWFDHDIDLYYQWLSTKNSLWLERGIFSGLSLKGGHLLELSCGDGFNSRNFYCHRSRTVIACDIDVNAISTARKKNAANNIDFVIADIRTNMPEGIFENIVWDAAIEHFTPKEIQGILENVKQRLTGNGVLSGYTIVERPDGKSLSHHEYEFVSMEDLRGFLTQHFENVTVFQTIYPDRHNLYFWASDDVLPFDQDWPNVIFTRGS